MRIVLEQIATTPSERAGRNWFSAVPSVCITVIVSNLQIAVIEEPLIVLLASTAHVVVGHRECRVVGIAHPKNRPVLAVVGDAPEACLGRDEGLVAIIIVVEGFGRLGEVDLIGLGRDEVVGFVAVRASVA